MKTKTILATIGIVLLVIVALVGGVLAHKYVMSEIAAQSATTPSVKPTSAQTAETAGWKTYQNSEYGFEFQYPDTFNDVSLSAQAKTGDQYGKILFDSKDAGGLNFAVQFQNEFHPEYLVADPRGADLVFDKSKVMLGGVESYKIFSVTCYMGCGSFYSVDIPYGNGAIQISFGKGDGSVKEYNDSVKITDAEKAMFDQIISTFKFTK